MVVDNKATVTYVQLIKEDLVIIRFVPKEGPVPEYKTGYWGMIDNLERNSNNPIFLISIPSISISPSKS